MKDLSKRLEEEESSLHDKISKELLLFDAGGATMRGPLMTKCYKWLLNIQVTSVEAERNFSQAGNICNKIRTRLTDRSVCEQSMLKTYFKQISNV
jgi:hypothetical protein